MIFSQLSVHIREKINRDNVETFQDLLREAREIELTLLENSESLNVKESKEKPIIRCTFCRKKNHSSDVCYKKIENERKGKQEEVKLSCYGCGASGYYRSNCPTCINKTTHKAESPKEIDFNSIHTTIVGRNVPTVTINVNGLNGEAYMDTAARTSVAGYYLFQKLKEKGLSFQEVVAEITLADGSISKDTVLSTIANIIIGNRLKRIRFICLPKARDNRTLLGIDFLEQSGIVMDLAQRTWHFKDEPQNIFEFKSKPSKAMEKVSIGQTTIIESPKTPKPKKAIDDFLNWFVEINKTPNRTSPMRNEYSPNGIDKIFANCLPESYETPKVSDLFPPLKRVKSNEESPTIRYFELNSIDFRLRVNEAQNLEESQKHKLSNMSELNRTQAKIGIGDKFLVDSHILSNESKGVTAKFTPRRDKPYVVIAKGGASCYVIAKEENPEVPIATHHVSALALYEGTSNKPIYPMRKRGRPKNDENPASSNNSITQIDNNSKSAEKPTQPRRSARLQKQKTK